MVQWGCWFATVVVDQATAVQASKSGGGTFWAACGSRLYRYRQTEGPHFFYVSTYLYTDISLHTYVYIHVYMCAYIYTYAYTYVYTITYSNACMCRCRVGASGMKVLRVLTYGALGERSMHPGSFGGGGPLAYRGSCQVFEVGKLSGK